MIRATLRKESMEQRDFKKHFKFHNFSEIFYCEFQCFIQCQYTRTILRNKNMGQSLFKFDEIFDEIWYCGMARFRNVELGVFRRYQNTEIILKKKNMGQNRFKKLSKF